MMRGAGTMMATLLNRTHTHVLRGEFVRLDLDRSLAPNWNANNSAKIWETREKKKGD